MASKLPAGFNGSFWKTTAQKAVEQAPRPSQDLKQKLGTVSATASVNTFNLATASVVIDGDDEAVTIPTAVVVYANDRVLLEKRNNVWTVVGNLSSQPARGLIAQGNRPINIGSVITASGLSGVAGIMKIDDLKLKANRAYKFEAGNIRVTSSSQGRIDLKYTANGPGTIANTTEIGRAEVRVLTGTNVPQPTGWVVPSTDTSTGSVVLSIFNVSNGQTTSVLLNESIWLNVYDMGPAVPNTGINL